MVNERKRLEVIAETEIIGKPIKLYRSLENPLFLAKDVYFSGLSKETQEMVINELLEKNKELQQFYNDLMNTEVLMSINTFVSYGIPMVTVMVQLKTVCVMTKKSIIK